MANYQLERLARGDFTSNPERLRQEISFGERVGDSDRVRIASRQLENIEKAAAKSRKEQERQAAAAERERKGLQRQTDRENRQAQSDYTREAIAFYRDASGRIRPITAPGGGVMKKYDNSGVLWDPDTGKPYKFENGQLRDASEDGDIVTKDGSVYRVDKGQPWKWLGYDKENLKADSGLTRNLSQKTQALNEAASAATGVVNALKTDIASDEKRLKEIDDDLVMATGQKKVDLLSEKNDLTGTLAANRERQAKAELDAYRAQAERVEWAAEKRGMLDEHMARKADLAVNPQSFPRTDRKPDATSQTGLGAVAQPDRETSWIEPVPDLGGLMKALSDQAVQIAGGMAEHARQVTDAMSQPDAVSQWTQAAMKPVLDRAFQEDRTALGAGYKLPPEVAKLTGVTHAPESWFTPEAMERQLTAKLAGQDKIKAPEGYRLDDGTLYAPKQESTKIFGVELPWTRKTTNERVGKMYFDEYGVPYLQLDPGAKVSPSAQSKDFYRGLPEYAAPTQDFIKAAKTSPKIGSQVVPEVRKEAEAIAADAGKEWNARKWGAERTRDFLDQWQAANDAERAEMVALVDPRQANVQAQDRKLDTRWLYENGFVSAQDARLIAKNAYGIEPATAPIATTFDEWVKTGTSEAAKNIRRQYGAINDKKPGIWETLLTTLNPMGRDLESAEKLRQNSAVTQAAKRAFLTEYYQTNSRQVDFNQAAFTAARDQLLGAQNPIEWAVNGLNSSLQNAAGSSAGIMLVQAPKLIIDDLYSKVTGQSWLTDEEKTLIGAQTQQAVRNMQRAVEDRKPANLGEALAMAFPASYLWDADLRDKMWSGAKGQSLSDSLTSLRRDIDAGTLTADSLKRHAAEIGMASEAFHDGVENGRLSFENDLLDPRSAMSRNLAAYLQTMDPAYFSAVENAALNSVFEQEIMDRASAYASQNGEISESSFLGPLQMAFRGAQVAPLTETAVEIASELFSAGVGKALTVGKWMARSERLGLTLNRVGRAIENLEGIEEKFFELGKVKAPIGGTLTMGQKARNFAVDLAKQGWASGGGEGLEEVVSAFGQAGATFDDAMAQGLQGVIGGVGLGAVHYPIGATIGAVQIKAMEAAQKKAMQTFVSDWNTRYADKPITLEQARQAQNYQPPELVRTLQQKIAGLVDRQRELNKAMADLPETVTTPSGKGGASVVANPRVAELAGEQETIKAELAATMADVWGVTENSIAAVQEINGLPEEWRHVADAAVRVSSGTGISPDQQKTLLEGKTEHGRSVAWVQGGRIVISDAIRAELAKAAPTTARIYLAKTEAQQMAELPKDEGQTPPPLPEERNLALAGEAASDEGTMSQTSPPAPPATPSEAENSSTASTGRYVFEVTYLPIGSTQPVTATRYVTADSLEQAERKRDTILKGLSRMGKVQGVSEVRPENAETGNPENSLPAAPQNRAFVPAENTATWTPEALRAAISNAAAAFGYRIVDTGIPAGTDAWGNVVNIGTAWYDKMHPGSEIGQWIDAMNAGTNPAGYEAIQKASSIGLHRVWFGHDFTTNIGRVVEQFGWGGVPDYIGQLLKDSLTKSGIPFPGVELLVRSGLVSDRVATDWLSTNIGEVFGGGVAFLGTYRLYRAAKNGSLTKPRVVFATIGIGIKTVAGVMTAQPFLVLSGLADAAILVTNLKQVRAAFLKGQEVARTKPAPDAVAEASAGTKQTTPNKAGDIKEAFGNMGGAIAGNFHKALFDALQAGKTSIAGGLEKPLLAKLKPFYDAGRISSPQDIRNLSQSGELDRGISNESQETPTAEKPVPEKKPPQEVPPSGGTGEEERATGVQPGAEVAAPERPAIPPRYENFLWEGQSKAGSPMWVLRETPAGEFEIQVGRDTTIATRPQILRTARQDAALRKAIGPKKISSKGGEPNATTQERQGRQEVLTMQESTPAGEPAPGVPEFLRGSMTGRKVIEALGEIAPWIFSKKSPFKLAPRVFLSPDGMQASETSREGWKPGNNAMVTYGGRILMDQAGIVRTLNALPEANRRAWLESVIEEELEHFAQQSALTAPELAAIWNEAPEAARQRVVEAYYPGELLAANGDWRAVAANLNAEQAAQEFLRMYRQALRTGATTEQTLMANDVDTFARLNPGFAARLAKALADIARFMREELLGLLMGEARTRFEDAIARIEARRAEIERTIHENPQAPQQQGLSPDSAGQNTAADRGAGRQVENPAGQPEGVTKQSPPSLGSTAMEVWRKWRELSMGLPMGFAVVGFFPGEGTYQWNVDGKLDKVVSDARRGTSYIEKTLTPTEEDAVWNLLVSGSLQIERRRTTGMGGVYPKSDGGKTLEVLHQATGRPIPESDPVTQEAKFSPEANSSAFSDIEDAELRGALEAFDKVLPPAAAKAAVYGMTPGQQSEAVSILTGPSLTEVAEKAIVATGNETAIEAAYRWARENVPSGIVRREGIGEVAFDRGGVKDSLGHGFGQDKLDALPAVPAIIERGAWLGEAQDFDGKELDNIYLAGPIRIGSRERTLFVRLHRDVNGTRFYVHETYLTEALKKSEPGAIQTLAKLLRSKPQGGTKLYENILSAVLGVNPPPAAFARATPEFISAATQLSDVLWRRGYDTPEKFAEFLHGRFSDRITPKVLSQVWSLGANTDPDVAVNWSKVHAEAVRPTVEPAAGEAATHPKNDLPQPTIAQEEAGNFKKGHVNLSGLDITIEKPAGSLRSGVDAKGERWQSQLKSHYGYVKRTTGADGEHLDVFIKPETPLDWKGTVYVIDQVDSEGKFDEHKAVIGASSAEEARELYLENYAKDWKGFGGIALLPFEEFKDWAINGDKTKGTGNRDAEPGRQQANDLPQRKAADAVQEYLMTSDKEMSWKKLFDIANKAWGGTQASGAYTVKDAYDALELGINKFILGMGAGRSFLDTDAEGAANVVRSLESLILSKIPTQTKQTQESDDMQQFSTPPHFSYVANWVAHVAPGDVMLEPSAGIGGLAVFSKKEGATVIANELSKRRRAFINELGFDHVIGENAEQLHAILEHRIASGELPRPTVVVMNPPFSNSAKSGKKGKTIIGAQHVEEALKLLAPGGRLTAIVGEGMAMDATTFRAWWKKIADEYNVRANILVDGKNYAKYGTTFSNRLIVIDKTGQTTDLKAIVGGQVDTIAQLPTLLEEIRNDRSRGTSIEPASPQAPEPGRGAGIAEPTSRSSTGSPGNTGRKGGQSGSSVAQSSDGGQTDSGTKRGGRRNDGSPRADGNTDQTASGTPGRPAGEPTGSGAGNPASPQASGSESRPAVADTGITVSSADTSSRQIENEDDVFALYKPAKLRIPGAQKHLAPLVESAAMASVSPPNPAYTPNLPKEVITEGKISETSLENIVYAGQAHQQMLPTGERRGYFIGDGTGVGKGRQIAGIIMDNMRQGRTKAVWLSEKEGLMDDAKRDASDVGLDPEKITFLGKTKKGNPIEKAEGIIFSTYATLKGGHDGILGSVNDWWDKARGRHDTRIRQLVNWLGEDFDGVIAFDEAHNAGNAVAMQGNRGVKKPSATGVAVVDVQRALPKARVVYVSATGATEVENLSYADRLGIWGEGTPFSDKLDFFAKIRAGGISAMEIVARDLKAQGLYLARSISYKGVEFSRLTQNLTPEQTALYNTIAGAWQNVLENLDEAMGESGANHNANARSAAMSAFWGAQQRFFNQLLTAMELPVVLADMERELAAGHSLVLQIVNTNEATQNRQIAQKQTEAAGDKADLEDLDLSPRDILLQYLDKSFPTTKFEQVADPNNPDRTVWVPLRDASGNVVQDPQAVAKKQALMDRLATLDVPGNPLEQIIEKFGEENVAEITGRTQRVVSVKQEDGSRKTLIQKRTPSHRKVEAKEFQDGKRRINIFSDAGGTGYSFHASNRDGNRQRRIHYLVQAGWRADKALQGFGRTHRTDQASAPIYKLAETNIAGHKRFISTIARRLAQLGALTTGERKSKGSGIFSENDNLESHYSTEAITRLVYDLHAGRVEGYSFEEFSKGLGFNKTVTDEGGELVTRSVMVEPNTGQLIEDKIPAIPQFLNRVLALPLEEQNRVFDLFMERMERRIRNAMVDGTYDPGTQAYKAQEMRKLTDETVFEQPGTGAQTRLVEIEEVNPVEFTAFEDIAKLGDRPVIDYVRNRKSGRIYALKGAPNETDAVTGAMITSLRRIGTRTYDKIRASDMTTEGDNAKYDFITKGQASAAWEEEISGADKLSRKKVNFLVGAMLPVWDRIQIEHPKIYRFTTTEGEPLLGVLLPPREVSGIRQRMGAKNTLSPQEVFDLAREEGGVFGQTNGWTFRRSMVSGEYRIELSGLNYGQADLFVKQFGGQMERIQYRPRYFIQSVEVMERVLAQSPLITMNGQEIASVAPAAATAPAAAAAQAMPSVATKFNFSRLSNRRFLSNGKELILGSGAGSGNNLQGSHAEDFDKVYPGGRFDTYPVHGWVWGKAKGNPNGGIQFSPPLRDEILEANPEIADVAYRTIEKFIHNGASSETLLRNIGSKFETTIGEEFPEFLTAPAAARSSEDPAAVARFNDNLALATWFASKYRNIRGVQFDDLLSEARIGLWKAAERFEGGRGIPFGSYASYIIRNRLNELYRRQQRIRETASLDAPAGEGTETVRDAVAAPFPATARPEELADAMNVINEEIARLPDRPRRIWEMFRDGASWREIGPAFGISHERARQVARGFANTLRAALEKRGITSVDDLIPQKDDFNLERLPERRSAMEDEENWRYDGGGDPISPPDDTPTLPEETPENAEAYESPAAAFARRIDDLSSADILNDTANENRATNLEPSRQEGQGTGRPDDGGGEAGATDPQRSVDAYAAWLGGKTPSEARGLSDPERAFRVFVEETGRILPDGTARELRESGEDVGGEEHWAYLIGNRMWKVLRPGKGYAEGGDPLDYLLRLARLQAAVPQLGIRFHGILPGKSLRIVTSMEYISGEHPTVEFLTQWLRDHGWDEVGSYAWSHSDTGVEMADAAPDNFIQVGNDVVPIDVQFSGDVSQPMFLPEAEGRGPRAEGEGSLPAPPAGARTSAMPDADRAGQPAEPASIETSQEADVSDEQISNAVFDVWKSRAKFLTDEAENHEEVQSLRKSLADRFGYVGVNYFGDGSQFNGMEDALRANGWTITQEATPIAPSGQFIGTWQGGGVTEIAFEKGDQKRWAYLLNDVGIDDYQQTAIVTKKPLNHEQFMELLWRTEGRGTFHGERDSEIDKDPRSPTYGEELNPQPEPLNKLIRRKRREAEASTEQAWRVFPVSILDRTFDPEMRRLLLHLRDGNENEIRQRFIALESEKIRDGNARRIHDSYNREISLPHSQDWTFPTVTVNLADTAPEDAPAAWRAAVAKQYQEWGIPNAPEKFASVREKLSERQAELADNQFWQNKAWLVGLIDHSELLDRFRSFAPDPDEGFQVPVNPKKIAEVFDLNLEALKGIANQVRKRLQSPDSRAPGDGALPPAAARAPIEPDIDLIGDVEREMDTLLTGKSKPGLAERLGMAGDADKLSAVYRSVFSGRLDKVDAYVPGAKKAIQGAEREEKLATLHVNALLDELRSQVKQAFGDPAFWSKKNKRLKTATIALLPTAARLEVSHLDDEGNFVWKDFERRAGLLTPRAARKRRLNTGDRFEDDGRTYRVGEFLPEENAFQVLEHMSPEQQQGLYEWFVAAFPEVSPVLDRWIMPGNDTARIQTTHGTEGVEFNRYALLNLFNTWPPELQDALGRDFPLPEVQGIPGYTPDIAVQRGLSAVIGAILGRYKSPGRLYKTGAMQEMGNHKNLLDGFSVRAMEAHREKIRMKMRETLIEKGVLLEDQVSPARIESGEYVRLDDAYNMLMEAQGFIRQLNRETYPHLSQAMNPEDQIKLSRLVGDMVKLRGMNRVIHSSLYRELKLSMSRQATEHILLRLVNWLLHAAKLGVLTGGSAGMNWIGNQILKSTYAMNRAFYALTSLAVGDFRSAKISAITVVNLLRGAITDIFPNTLNSRRIGEVIPRALFDDSTMLASLDMERSSQSIVDDFKRHGLKGAGQGALEAFRRGGVPGSILYSVNYAGGDAAAKQQLAYAAYRARAEIAADEAGIAGKARRAWKRQWIKDQIGQGSEVHREVMDAANLFLMDYGNVPAWMDPSASLPEEKVQRFLKSNGLWFMKWPYNYYRLIKSLGGEGAANALKPSATKAERAEGLAGVMTLGALIAGGAWLLAPDYGDDDDKDSVIGTRIDKEGNPLDRNLDTSSRLNASAIARRTRIGRIIGTALRMAGLPINADFTDREGNDFWLFYRNIPWINEMVLGGRLSRGDMAGFLRDMGPYLQDQLALGILWNLAGATMAGSMDAKKEAPNLMADAYWRVLTAPFLPEALTRRVRNIADPVTRRTTDSGALGFDANPATTIQNRIPFASRGLPAAGTPVEAALAPFDSESWFKGKMRDISNNRELSPEQKSEKAQELREELAARTAALPGSGLEILRTMDVNPASVDTARTSSRNVALDLARLQQLGVGPESVRVYEKTTKQGNTYTYIAYPDPKTVRRRDPWLDAFAAFSGLNIQPVPKEAYSEAVGSAPAKNIPKPKSPAKKTLPRYQASALTSEEMFAPRKTVAAAP